MRGHSHKASVYGQKRRKNLNKFIKNVALYVLLIVIVVSMFNTFMAPQQQRSEITYSDFVTQVDNKNVQSVVMS